MAKRKLSYATAVNLFFQQISGLKQVATNGKKFAVFYGDNADRIDYDNNQELEAYFQKNIWKGDIPKNVENYRDS